MKNADMPAYPTMLKAGDVEKSEGGLTKREYFSAMALQGLMSGKDGDSRLHDSAPEWVAAVTEAAVEFADALLAELERTK